MRRLGLAAVLLASLGACTAEQQAFVAGGIAAKQAESDTEARIAKAALCVQTVGAFYRINTLDERAAIETLCNPAGRPQEPSFTVEQIRALQEAPAR